MFKKVQAKIQKFVAKCGEEKLAAFNAEVAVKVNKFKIKIPKREKVPANTILDRLERKAEAIASKYVSRFREEKLEKPKMPVLEVVVETK